MPKLIKVEIIGSPEGKVATLLISRINGSIEKKSARTPKTIERLIDRYNQLIEEFINQVMEDIGD